MKQGRLRVFFCEFIVMFFFGAGVLTKDVRKLWY